jgi:hypothetical protein
MRDEREDVAPHGRILAAAVVEHDHATRFDVIDVVTNGPRWLAGWPVENRERPPGQSEAWIERLDVEARTMSAGVTARG